MGLKARGGLDNAFDAAWIVDAGKLDEDLVAAELIGLNDGFRDAEGVDALLMTSIALSRAVCFSSDSTVFFMTSVQVLTPGVMS